MDSMEVNMESLDSMVRDYIESEDLLEVFTPSASSISRVVISEIRRMVIDDGDIESAIVLIDQHAPRVLSDKRVCFPLFKQRFIELLRSKERDSAIMLMREAILACPENFEELVHVFSALLFNENEQYSPVAYEWSKRRRLDLAWLLTSLLREYLHAYDPYISMNLKYLIGIHNIYCYQLGLSSPIPDLTENLISNDKDHPATFHEFSLQIGTYNEADVQSLVHAVELTKQESIDSLYFSRGSLFQAFKNELSSWKMDVSMLNNIIHEYCIYRGIIDISTDHSSVAEMTLPKRASGDWCLVIDLDTKNIGLDGKENSAVDAESQLDFEKRFAFEVIKSDSCSTCDTDNSPPLTQNTENEEQNLANYQEKCAIVLEMKQLANKGLTEEIVEKANALDPNFFNQYPDINFLIKEVEFCKYIKAANDAVALDIACQHLGPLAESNKTLMKRLKRMMMILIYPIEATVILERSLPELATSLEAAMKKTLKIKEPRLLKLMRSILYTQNEWFELQKEKDPFEQFLNIDQLKSTAARNVASPKLFSEDDSHTDLSSNIDLELVSKEICSEFVGTDSEL